MNFLSTRNCRAGWAHLLTAAGHDAVHTLDLPGGNRTPDQRDNRVLVTKDSDFNDSFFLRSEPPRLLLVSTGDITNRELEALFRARLADVVLAFGSSRFLELDRNGITARA